MLSSFTSEDLRSLKRTQLQKLAKQNGVKANLKTDDIVAALDKLIAPQTASHITEEHKSNIGTLTAENSDVSIEKAESSFDIMSVKPPWESSELDVDSPNVSEPSQLPKVSMDSLNKIVRRTRSSSRNRTPKSTESAVRLSAGKTFSVERKTASARTTQPVGKVVKPEVQKRKSQNNALDSSAIRLKKVKRDNEGRCDTDDKTDEDLKDEIMREIRQNIAESNKKNTGKKSKDDIFSTRIPRFAASGVSIGSSKPITPGSKNWGKLHERRFEKLESIDDYEERKKERAKRLLGSRQKNTEAISRLAQPSRKGGSKIVKPVTRKQLPMPNFCSPAPRVKSKTPQSIMKTPRDVKWSKAKTPTERRGTTFKPTVTSTSKMNCNFGRKSSKMQTPKRVTIVSDQNAAKQKYVKTPGTGIRSKSVSGTPGEKRKSFTATPKASDAAEYAATTPGGTKKPVFNLKESLKKPISWVPHTGPLRPYNDTTKKPSFQDRIDNLKNPKVPSREMRRQKMADKKRQDKDRRMLQRRGIK